jgi:hypothetical protein
MDEGGRNAVVPLVRRMGVDYVVLVGDSKVSCLYGGLEVLPTTYYIAPDGTVRAFVNGVISKTDVEHDIKEVLGSGVRN